MPNLNRVLLMGNLTRDTEVKYTPKGTATCELSIAVNRVYHDDQGDKKEETTFASVECWGRQAEIAGEYLKKGRPVFIEGRLKLETWDDKETGQKRSKTKVICENLQLLGSRDSAGERPQQRQQTPPARQPARKPADPDWDADECPF